MQVINRKKDMNIDRRPLQCLEKTGKKKLKKQSPGVVRA